ncbi:Hypothetical protein, putative [Bodo saltans]|uniref:Uncharacterized protein n=1 Tax=Bodo saltans TaxID=75058 RepID=A0A0S4IU31_BODSA|nr:Hypothetical protein, putative [Bodo saltans]|eukprot:CUF84544.1 Hypothetical protein, putative [Bodo saltans]
MSSANSSRSSAFQSLKKIAIPLLAVCFIWIWTLSGQFTRSEEVIELGSRGRAWKVTEDVAPHRLIDAQPPSKLITTSEEMGTRFQNHQAVDSGNLVHVEGASSVKVCNHKLYTPTYATYVEGIQAHVIVDCWHHRVILLDSSDGVDALHALETPIPLWSDLTNITYVSSSSSSSGGGVVAAAAARKSLQSLNIPHSIATNGDIFVTESSVGGSNGDNHSLLVFRMVAPQSSRSGRPQLEYLEEVLGCDGNRARRPHRVIYDAESKSFFLYMTSPAFLSRFVWNTETQKLERVGCQSLPFMKGMYARSIVAHNGSLYFTAGPGVIWRTELDGVRGVVVAKQSYSIKYLGFTKGKMNDLAFFDGWWYATSTVPCAMVRFRNIDRLWEHEKIHTQLGLCKTFSRKEPRCLGGTPYFVSKIGDRIVVPYIFGCSGVVSFRVDDVGGRAPIVDVKQHWGGGWVEDSGDLQCRGTEW